MKITWIAFLLTINNYKRSLYLNWQTILILVKLIIILLFNKSLIKIKTYYYKQMITFMKLN